MSVIRTRRTRHFTITPNEALRSPELSLQAKGLLALMLSFPDDWAYNLKHLETLSSNKTHAHSSAMKELVEAGYVTKEKARSKGGHYNGWDYVVSDTPTRENHASAETGKPETGKSEIGKSATTKTDLYEEPIHEDSPPTPPQPAAAGPRAEEPKSPNGDALSVRSHASKAPSAKPVKAKGPSRSEAQMVLDAYNAHRGNLPKAQALNSARERKIKRLILDLGTVKEAASAMGIAAAEVANDEFWQRNKYGLDNLLNGQKVVQKAEAAVSRGTTDRGQAERDRLLAAIGGAS